MINRNFFCLWLGKLISQLGDKFYAIALAWWILQKTNSPSIMGLFLLVSTLPGILLGIIAGVVTDKWNKKKMLICTDILRGLLVFSISYLSISGSLLVWHIFVIGCLLSAVTAFFDPAIQAILPEIVDKKDFTKANSLSQMVQGGCMVAGPMFGALSVSFFGIAPVFFINGISFLLSSILTCFIKVKNTERPLSSNPLIKDIKEGLKFIKNQQKLIIVLAIIAVTHIFVGGISVMLPFLAKQLQGDGVNNLGYLEMFMGAGLLCGSILLRMKKKMSISISILINSISILSITILLTGLFKQLNLKILYPYLLIMATIGVCISWASVLWQTLLQSSTPKNMMGRIFSVSALLGNTSLPIAYGLFGMLLSIFTLPVLLFISGFFLVIFCIILFVKSKNLIPLTITEE